METMKGQRDGDGFVVLFNKVVGQVRRGNILEGVKVFL